MGSKIGSKTGKKHIVLYYLFFLLNMFFLFFFLNVFLYYLFFSVKSAHLKRQLFSKTKHPPWERKHGFFVLFVFFRNEKNMFFSNPTLLKNGQKESRK